jgi:tetratricopeptide (TPR) repeat protein
MKKWTLFLFLLSLISSAFAQVTKEQLDELQKKLQKQRDSVMNLPQVKKYLKDPDVKLPTAETPTRPVSNIGGGNSSFDKMQLPPKDSIKLKNIPTKVFSPEELRTYCSDLYNKIAQKLPQATVDKVNRMYEEVKNKPADIETAAVLVLQGGADEEAALLAAKAASNTSDGTLLANAAAVLDMTGLSDKAIPILRTVVQRSSNNVTALNNLGQAYTALGQQDSALRIFSRCLSYAPEHPEANNTAGVIELKRGNDAKARQYFENSIRGGFNTSAYAGLKHILKEKTRIAPLIRPKIKMPGYFNQFKYKLPRQLLNVTEAEAVELEQKQFRMVISQAIRAYQALGKEAEMEFAKKSPQERNAAIMRKVNKGESYMRPFQVLGGIMEAETILEYNDDFHDLEYFNKTNRAQYKALEEEYKKKYEAVRKRYDEKDDDCCGEGNISCCNDGEKFCIETNNLKNEYLPKFAAINEEYQSRNLLIEIKHLDNFLYWGYFAAWDRDDYKVRFYSRVATYLRTLQRLDVVKILEPCESNEEEEEKKKEEEEPVKSMDCPISLQIPLGVLKINLDCESISIRGGKGVFLSYEKNFVTRQSTWILGVGDEPLDREYKYGGFDIKIGMAVFLTIDGAGNVSDGGISALATATSSFPLGFDVGEKLKFKESVGWRLGYNSGLTLAPGRLKNLIDKIGPAPERQVNRNVRLSNGNQ